MVFSGIKFSMLLCFILLSTTSTLSAGDNSANPTENDNQMKLNADNRFLRGGPTTNDDGDEYENLLGEERGGKTLAQKFAKWRARGDTADDVFERFALKPVVREALKNGKMADLYKNPYYRKWASYAVYRKDQGLNW